MKLLDSKFKIVFWLCVITVCLAHFFVDACVSKSVVSIILCLAALVLIVFVSSHYKKTANIAVHYLLIIGSIFMLFPFVWMISTSVKSEQEILSTNKELVILPNWVKDLTPSFLRTEKQNQRIEKELHDRKQYELLLKTDPELALRYKKNVFDIFDNYREVFEQPFYRYFLNTFFVAITTTALSLFFASLSAYAYAFFNFPFKDAIFMLMLGTMMLPHQALLIPNYIVLSKIGWINSYFALIVPWLASVYAVFFLRQFFLQLPKDLYGAAIIDGCSKFQFYYKVVLPLSKPPMVTLGIFSFLSSWNSFVWPLIVTNDTNLRVIQVGLSYFSSDSGTRWGPLMAASTVTILPLVIMYFIAQKQFIESQAMSGMKE